MANGAVNVRGLLLVPALLLGCHDVTRFSSDHYEGTVVAASFVRSGVEPATRLCLSLDANKLQEGPGTMSSTDGRFQSTPLRPIAPVWRDPLSTLSFGEDREMNLLYLAQDARLEGRDALVVISLMKAGGVEVRLLGGALTSSTPPVFAVFPMEKASGPCSF